MKEISYKSNTIYTLTGRPCTNFMQELEMAQIATENKLWTHEEEEKNPNIFYIPEFLVGSLFPHQKIDSNVWVADRSLHTVRISSCYGVPYGTLPRLLFAYVANNPYPPLFLGKSRKDFKRTLECNLSDRKFDFQLRNLFFHTLIDIEVEWGASRAVGTDSCLMVIGARDPAWRNYKDLKNPKWKKELLIHPLFGKLLREAKKVPFNFRSYLSLSESPLAMDLYIWLSCEWSALQEKEKSKNSYTLHLLQEVFGCEEKSISEFKEELVNCFHKALPYFPGFQNNVKLSEDGKHLVLTKPKKSVEAILKKDDE